MTKETWGNIELPGISDKELLTKNWNKSAGVQDSWQDPQIRQRRQQGIQKVYQEPGMSSEMSRRGSRPKGADHAQRVREANLGLKKTQETKAKISQTQLGNQKHVKPLLTPEGVFASQKLAAQHYETLGLVNAGRKIQRYLKENQPGWKTISKEEYEQLKEKTV